MPMKPTPSGSVTIKRTLDGHLTPDADDDGTEDQSNAYVCDSSQGQNNSYIPTGY